MNGTTDPNANSNIWDTAVAEGAKELAPGYDQALATYKNEFLANLAKQKQDYATQAANTENNYNNQMEFTADPNEATNGTAFSSGRIERNNIIANQYNNELGQEQRTANYNIGELGRNYESEYGTPAVTGTDFSTAGGTFNPITEKFVGGGNSSSFTPASSQNNGQNIYGSQPTSYIGALYKRAQIPGEAVSEENVQ